MKLLRFLTNQKGFIFIKNYFPMLLVMLGNPIKRNLLSIPMLLEIKLLVKTDLKDIMKNILSGKPSEITLQNGEIIDITPAIPGQDIQITIDVNAQEVVKESLQQGIVLANKSFETINLIERGAVVVQKIDTGEITAMVSLPDFDPNQFVSGISEFEFKKLNRTQAF